MNSKLFFTVLVALFFASCKNEGNEKKLANIFNGNWSIDLMIYKKWDVLTCMRINTMHFYNDSIFVLPTTPYCDSIELRDDNSNGIHNFFYKNRHSIQVFVETQNKLFQDTLNVQFVDDVNNKLMKMELQSKDLYILCTKGMFGKYSDLKRDISEIADIKEIQVPYNR